MFPPSIHDRASMITTYIETYTKPKHRLKKPTQHKETSKKVAWEVSGYEKSKKRITYDASMPKSKKSRYPNKYIKEVIGDEDVNIALTYGSSKLPPIPTTSEENEMLMTKLEHDRKILRWKEWQFYSIPKLIRKYPSYENINPTVQLIPHKKGDPKLIPYQFRKAYERALRFRSSDKDHFDSETRTKIQGLRLNHHDGKSIQRYLRS